MKSKNKTQIIQDNLQCLSDLIAEPIIIINMTGKIVLANQCVKEVLGYETAELVNRSFREMTFLDQTEKAKLADNFVQRMKGLKVEPYEIKVTAKNGDPKYFEIKGKKIIYRDEPADLVFFHDTTQRREIQENLKSNLEIKHQELIRNEEKLRSIFESSPDPITVSDLNGNITDCNPAALKTFEYTNKKEVLGRNFLEFISKTDHQKALNNLKKTLQKGSIESIEYTALAKSGHKFPVEISIGIIREPANNPPGLVAIIKDISERKNTEKKLAHLAKFPAQNPNPVMRIAKNGTLLYANRAAKLLLKNLKIRVGKAIPPQINRSAMEALTSGVTKVAEYHEADQIFLFTFTPVTEANYVNMYGIEITDLKKIENALAESEQKYRMLFEGALDAIVVADIQTGIMAECNPAALKMFGKEKSEIIGHRQSELHPKESMHEEYLNSLQEHLKNSAIPMETQVLTKTGKIREVTLRASIFEICGRKLIQSTFRDITDNKKMQMKLKQERDMLESVTSNIGSGLTLISKDYRILWSNDLLKKIFGEDLKGKFCYQKLHNRDQICENCGVRKVIEGAGTDVREFSYQNDMRKTITMEVIVTPVKDDNGQLVAALELAIPITERKLMEQQLQASEEKFRAISNSVRDAIILVDSMGTVEYWNPASEKTFGYTKEETVGKQAHELLIPNSTFKAGKIAIKKGLKFFGETGEGAFMNENIELISRRKDGTEFPMKLSLSPIKLGNSWHAVGVAKDVTERKQNERLAREYAEKLEKAVEAKTNELKEANASLLKLERLAAIGELAGMIGHDLRNPLTGIKNAAYFLKKKGNTITPRDYVTMFEIIERSIKHSDKIINDLLEYAREMHLELRIMPIEKLIKEALTSAKVPQYVKVIIDVPADLKVRADETKLERVFINLINNAVDAMPEAGTLTITCKQNDTEIESSFADTGGGISQDILPKVFSPLFTTKAQGMGFGLAICKRIIEAHQGSILIRTAQGEGTTITLTLPKEIKTKTGGEETWTITPASLLSMTTKI